MSPARAALLAAALLAAACTNEPTPASADAGQGGRLLDYDVAPFDGGTAGTPFCDLAAPPVPGSAVPAGFCLRLYARVPVARTMALADDGALFVSSPDHTPAGTEGGASAIMVVRDADGDGAGEATPFLTGPLGNELDSVHGLAVADGWLYFTTRNAVWRVARAPGADRATSAPERLAGFDEIPSGRYFHALTAARDGRLLTSQGVSSAIQCPDNPRVGWIGAVAGGTTTRQVEGLRNPMYLRCHDSGAPCLASELGDDGGINYGARERLVLTDPTPSYGYPCCSGRGAPSPFVAGGFDCAAVPQEAYTLALHDTPFGFDWERGVWPAPFRDAVFIALHGSVYSIPDLWAGASVVFVDTDPTTHLPRGPLRPFVLGFGPGGAAIDRPSDVLFAPDGRMFFTDDEGGAVFWVAPLGLRRPAP